MASIRARDLTHLKGLASDLRKRVRRNQVFGSQEYRELPLIQLGNQYVFEACECVAEVPRKRVEVAQVDAGHGQSEIPDLLNCGRDGSESSSPAHNQQVAALWTIDLRERDLVGDARDLCGSLSHHFGVVVGVVNDVARDRRLGEPANSVLQFRRARNCPRSCTGVGVSFVRLEALGVVLGDRKLQFGSWEGLHRRDAPGLGAVCEIAVREHHHRGHESRGEVERLDHGVKTVARAACRDYRDGALGMSSEQCEQKVALLRLCR